MPIALTTAVFHLNFNRTLWWSVLVCGFLALRIPVIAQETWDWELLDPLAGSPNLVSITYGNGRFVAVGLQSAVFTSIDGRQWEKQSTGVSLDLEHVTFGNGLFVATGSRQAGWHTESIEQFESIILTSPDGKNWTSQFVKTDLGLSEVLWANGLFVAVGYNFALSLSYPLGKYSGAVYTSVSGKTWIEGTAPAGADSLCDVTCGNGQWLIRTESGDAWLSNNARDWVQSFHFVDIFDNRYGPSDQGNSYSSDLTFIESLNAFVFVGTSINGDHTKGLWVNTSSDGRDWFGAITCSTKKEPRTYAPMRTVLGLDSGLVFVGEGIVTAYAHQPWDKMTMIQFARPLEFIAVAASPAIIVALAPGGIMAVADRKINHTPTVAPITDKTLMANSNLEIPLVISDAETALNNLGVDSWCSNPDLIDSMSSSSDGTNWFLFITPRNPGSGIIHLVVTDEGYQPAETTFNLAVFDPSMLPEINSQPQNQMVAMGTLVRLSVGATGNGSLTYQWRKNGLNLAGATNSSYTITTAQPNQSGSYSVMVSNAYGSITSSEAVLMVLEPLKLAPGQLTFQPGGGVSLTLNVPIGVRIVLEASADLRQWETVADRVTSTSSLHLEDAVAVTSRARFYRVKYLQP